MEYYICGYIYIMIKGFAGADIPDLHTVQGNVRKL